MPDEQTAGEVGRALDVFRDQYRVDQTQIRDQLTRVVYRDVYHADQLADRDKRAALQREIDEVRGELVEAKRAVERAKADRAANRKVVIISVIIPIGLAVAEIVFTIRGGH